MLSGGMADNDPKNSAIFSCPVINTLLKKMLTGYIAMIRNCKIFVKTVNRGKTEQL